MVILHPTGSANTTPREAINREKAYLHPTSVFSQVAALWSALWEDLPSTWNGPQPKFKPEPEDEESKWLRVFEASPLTSRTTPAASRNAS